MKKEIVAARTAQAIDQIAEKTGIDLSQGFPKSKDPFVQRMHQLELLAGNLPEFDPDQVSRKEILKKIESTKGVGEALFKRIEEQV